ncbi:MAG TPA: transporter, partial [Bryobacteraceae bacterium]|nr:transporter [Bryobacteraceae bacterium]
VFSDRTSASGIGDVTFRGKFTAYRGESSAFAIAADVRAPTGDEYNFLGSGAPGVRPFVAYSISRGRVAPHFNVGYQWNGSSVLAGSVLENRKAHLPNAFTYAAGVDLAAHRRVTFAADFLGERVFKGQTIEIRNSGADLLGRSFEDSQLQIQSFNLLTGAVGTKITVYNTLLVTANVLFRLNDSGLKANVVPLIGLSYSF